MENNDAIIKNLNRIIEIANDGRCGYENAAKNVNDDTLKALFTQYSDERASFVRELKDEVLKLGGDPEEGGDALGALHRTWMNITSGLASGERADVLKSCITGEQAAVKAYTEGLQNETTSDIRDLLDQQLTRIKSALENIQSLEQTVSSI